MEVIDPQALEPARSWSAEVTEASQVAEVRRRATALARRQGFDDTREGALALIVTEAATNLVKHGHEGQIVVAPLERGGVLGIEVLALDRGPGMVNVHECLVDGFSTSGTQGTGLGAIRRLADEFDVHSIPDRGTALLARLWAAERPRRDVDAANGGRLDVGGVCLPIAGEDVPGDAWSFADSADAPRLFVVDGLGHGPVAAEAAQAAVESFRANAARPLVEIMEAVHDALRATRGAVAGVAQLDLGRGVVDFAGIGNIAGAVSLPGRQKNLVSLGGTMGHVIPRLREFAYEWPAQALLILHSDGLGTKWSLDDYRGLAGRDPTLVAGVLYRDHARGRDDVTVAVARRRSSR